MAYELFKEVHGCGYIDPIPRDAGDHWEFLAYVGKGATKPDPNPIIVDKKTGLPSWATADRIWEKSLRYTPNPDDVF